MKYLFLDKIVGIILEIPNQNNSFPSPSGILRYICAKVHFSGRKFINGHIIVNFSLNHGDMNKCRLDKIVGIILEFPSQNSALPSPAGILRTIGANGHCSGQNIRIRPHIILHFTLNHGDINKLCLNKIVGIILELLNENNALPSPAGILRLIGENVHVSYQKFLNGHIIVNFPLNHGDMNKCCLDKIVGIILEVPKQNNAFPSPWPTLYTAEHVL